MGKLRLHFRMLKPDLDSPMKVRREATGSVVLISVAASTVRAGFSGLLKPSLASLIRS